MSTMYYRCMSVVGAFPYTLSKVLPNILSIYPPLAISTFFFSTNCFNHLSHEFKGELFTSPSSLTHKFWHNVQYPCKTMPKNHITRYMHLEVSSAGSFRWLCMLWFTVFFHSVFPVRLMRAWLPYMGMWARAHSLWLHPHLLRHSSALCFTDYCQHLIRDDSNKVLLLLLIFFQVNERQLTLLNFPKVASIRQKLIVLLFLVDLFRVDLFTSST